MGLRLGEESFRQSQWVRCGRTDVETDEASELLVRSWRVYTAYTTSGIYKSAFVHGRWAIVLLVRIHAKSDRDLVVTRPGVYYDWTKPPRARARAAPPVRGADRRLARSTIIDPSSSRQFSQLSS